jgi:hypothetical protein
MLYSLGHQPKEARSGFAILAKINEHKKNSNAH